MNVLILDAESRHTLNVMHCFARTEDVKIYAVSTDRLAYCRFSRYCKKFIVHDFTKKSDAFFRFVKELVRRHQIDFVFPVDASTIALLSENVERFKTICNVPLTPNFELIGKIADKWSFYEMMRGWGLPTPLTARIEKWREIPLPLIFKPRNGEGGEGIFLINTKNEVHSEIDDKNYIVQEYIEGYDIDCSFLSDNGELLAYTIQKPIKSQKDELNFVPSKDIGFCHEERIAKIIKKLIKKSGWSGVAHADLRYCNKRDKFLLIEVNPRYWSSLLGSLEAGVNFPVLSLYAAKAKNDYSEIFYVGAKTELLSHLGLTRKLRPAHSTLSHILTDPLPYLANKLVRRSY